MNVKMKLEDLSLEELTFITICYTVDQPHTNQLTSTRTRVERMDICRGCEHYREITEDDTDDEEFIGKSLCEHCGCILDHKVTEITQICPEDKWGPSKEDWIKNVYPTMKEFIEENGIIPTEW
tara:strand:- start:19 stop:387 length:369 start_codon:yes stop_codon:yes gene_type:complete